MDLILHGDIFTSHIYQNLSIINIYNLSLTCKAYSNINKIKLVDRLNEIINIRLEKIFGDKISEFYSILQNTGGIISGSYILQCILNEKWDNSDIDIYIPMQDNIITATEWDNPKSEMDDFIYGFYSIFASYDSDRYNDIRTPKIISKMKFIRNFWLLTDDYNNMETIGEDNLRNFIDINNDLNNDLQLSKKIRDDNKIKYNNDNIIINKLDFKINNIQIILVNIPRDKMTEFINDEYDFDICKNIFSREKNRGDFRIKSFENIVSKTTKFNYTHSEEGSLIRKTKYEKHGFQFI